MERDNLIQIVTLIVAIVALILAVFSVLVPVDDEDEDGAENEAPTAIITVTNTTIEEMESLLFDASGSSDSDGVIVKYFWNFGDGGKDSGMYTNHAYNTNNVYTVTLTVVDNDGETATTSTSITVTEVFVPENFPPLASMFISKTSTNTYDHINYDGSSSTDSDGSIVMYLWDFGDGTNATGIYTNHIYTSPGAYTITLMVTDDYGEKNSTSVNIIIINDPGGPPDNDPPVAQIDVDQTTVLDETTLQFDGSGSFDTDGAIVEFVWMKDGEFLENKMILDYHFDVIGTYNISLTVYDNDGASDTEYVKITVEQPIPSGILDFSRNAPNNYSGGIIELSHELKVADAYLYIWDESSGNDAIQNPIESGVPFQVGSGLKLTFNDSNGNVKMDGGDVWIIENGSHGDIIRLVYKTGETVAEYTIMETAPTGALSFTENPPGNYTGGIISLSDVLFISEASLFIEDTSTGLNATQEPVESGVSLQAGFGMTVTYTDSNRNGKMDAGDVWTVSSGEAGDIIKLIFIPTGEIIAQYTLF